MRVSNRIRYPGSPHGKRWILAVCELFMRRQAKALSIPPGEYAGNGEIRDMLRGAAWLSSARAVRCRLKCHNERNPSPRLPSVRPGTPWTLPSQDVRKAGMTSNQHGPYVRGYTRVTMGGTGGSGHASGSESPKPSSVRTGVCNPTPRSWIR